MDEFLPPNSIAINLTSEGYAITTSISNKASDKTFQQLLSRATYAERYIRASLMASNQEQEDTVEIADEE